MDDVKDITVEKSPGVIRSIWVDEASEIFTQNRPILEGIIPING